MYILQFFRPLSKYTYIILGTLLVWVTPLEAEVTISGNRVFITNNNTELKIDDKSVDANQFLALSKGMIATVEIGEDVDSEVTSGTATSVNAENQILGPVTSISPLQVLGQDIVIDGDTILVNSIGTFTLGELLTISGEFTDNNVLLASRIESINSLEEFKLMSHVSAINGNILQFGNLSLDINNVSISDCDSGIQPGQLVKFQTAFDANFDITQPLTNVSEFECQSGLVIIPVGNGSTTVQFSAEGFVTEIVDLNHFKLNSQLVETNASTQFINGTVLDLKTGVKLDAEGNFNVSTNLLTATKLEYSQVRFRIIAPVTPVNFDANQITVLGLTAVISPLTKDDDNLLPSISQDTQIEIEGYIDGSGNLNADDLTNKGLPDNNNTRLRGPVNNIVNPIFQILGVNVDTSSSTLIVNGSVANQATFFSALADGAEVDINNATFSSVTNTLSGGTITLEQDAGIGAKSPSPVSKLNGPGHQVVQADGLGALGKGRIFKYVIPTGALPVAASTQNSLSVQEGAMVTLDASASTGNSLTYQWQQNAGPMVSIQNPSNQAATFIAPQVNSSSTLVFDLTVTDNIGNTSSTTVTVIVNDVAPVSSGGGGGTVGWLMLLLLLLGVRKFRK